MSSSPSNVGDLQQQLAAQQQQMQQLQAAANAEVEKLRAQLAQQQAQIAAVSSSPSPGAPLHYAPSPRQVGRGDHIKQLGKPDCFAGNASDNARQWLVAFERWLSAAEVADGDRVRYAVTYLKGTASDWYTSIEDEMAPQTPSWDVFRRRFLDRFQPVAAAKVARAQLKQLRQLNSVAGYSQAFLRIVQLIPDMHVADQIEQYIHGLRRDLAMELDKKEPNTLSEAMDSAARIELMSRGRFTGFGKHPMSGGGYGYRPFHPSSSGSSSSSSAPMDTSAALNHIEDDFRFEGDAFSPVGTEYTVNHVKEAVKEVLNGMFQRGSRGPARGPPRQNGSKRLVPNLSKEDFERLSREGKCFSCKGDGHIARDCPQKKNSKN